MLQKVKCSNKCTVILQRQFLAYHLKSECPKRRIECQYCHIRNTYKFIEGQHKKICPWFPVFCSNKCGVTIPRNNIGEHKKICPLEIINCTYHDLGCNDIFTRNNQKRHHEESTEKHSQLMLSELISTKQKLTDTNRMLFAATEKLTNIQMELIDTRRDLICAERETASIKIALSNTQVELNSTKIELRNSERTLARYQKHFVTNISEVQSTIERDLTNVKENLVNYSSRISAVEIVTHQIAKLQHFITFSRRKVTADANQLVYQNAMTKMYESDQTCPVYIKIYKFNELIKNRGIWCSKPFYLSKNCQVRLRIDASQYSYYQGPSLKLDMIDRDHGELQGILKLFLLSQDTNYNDFCIVEKHCNCSITRWQQNIFNGYLPTTEKYVRDDSIIIYVSFVDYNTFLYLMIVAFIFICLVVISLNIIIS